MDAVILQGSNAMTARFLGPSNTCRVRAAAKELRDNIFMSDARARQLYIIGGRDQDEVLNSVERLGTDRVWETLPSMCQSSIQPAVAEMNQNLYVYGEILERLDPYVAGSQWENLGSGHERRCMAAVGVHEGCIYICGGSDNSVVLTSAERFNSISGRWEALPNMPQKRSRAMAGMIDGYFYTCGGFDGFKTLITCHRLNIANGSWEAVPSLSQRRCMAASAVVKGCLLVCGGSDREPAKLSDQALRVCESLDPITGEWRSVPPMETARSRAASCLVRGHLYVCGGLSGRLALTSVERLDVSSGTWDTLPHMATRRFGAAVGSLNGCLFVCGGNDGDALLNSVERFDLEEGAWKDVTAMAESRTWPVAIVV